jgi:preprotein translocase SecE subunit
LIVVVIFGIIALVNHHTLRTGGTWLIAGVPATNPWIVTVPFGTDHYVFMYHITLTVPVVIFVTACWFAWRVVNWPTFADFLIATEAEMNKVSWTTRKRLVQDTIVVLVTVFLMTVGLFALDYLWVKGLTLIDVLKFDTQAAVRKNQAGAQW